MADTATQSDETPGSRPSESESGTRREPGRNDSMTDRAKNASITQLVAAGDPIAIAAIASVFLSLFTFYVRGKRDQGIFMGLWAPTLLGLASYVESRDEE
ncbi:hypothetical protein [Halomarina oriensis]|uniref:Uncharacterized protein n=1 Tax=Halomarina oriensis TaxID=671145 RepID=A0A6B0GM12_9EURY|nr:hypothetical protein [Halomarina oriensis]MWG33175.1 hypothetical protein [Halomarina oriensis]